MALHFFCITNENAAIGHVSALVHHSQSLHSSEENCTLFTADHTPHRVKNLASDAGDYGTVF